MKFSVTSIALDLTSRPAPTVQGPRVEVIDTRTNALFRGCTTPWEIADRVETFWNRLNDSDEHRPNQCHRNTERVVVTNVAKVR